MFNKHCLVPFFLHPCRHELCMLMVFRNFCILLMWYFKYKLWDCFREITLHFSLNYLFRSEKILLKILPKVHAWIKSIDFMLWTYKQKHLSRETGPLPWEKKTLQSRFEEKSNLKLFVKVELPFPMLTVMNNILGCLALYKKECTGFSVVCIHKKFLACTSKYDWRYMFFKF
jgi:hypothetical protein